jgi:hypothetical protein
MKAGSETSRTEKYAPESSTIAHPLVSHPRQHGYNDELQQFLCNICAETRSRVPIRRLRAVSHPSTVDCRLSTPVDDRRFDLIDKGEGGIRIETAMASRSPRRREHE